MEENDKQRLKQGAMDTPPEPTNEAWDDIDDGWGDVDATAPTVPVAAAADSPAAPVSVDPEPIAASSEEVAAAARSRPSSPPSVHLQQTQRRLRAISEDEEEDGCEGSVDPEGPTQIATTAAGLAAAAGSLESSEAPEPILRDGDSETPSALRPVGPRAPTTPHGRLEVKPQADRTARSRSGRTPSKTAQVGPSNYTLIVLWTVALVSVGLAVYFVLVR